MAGGAGLSASLGAIWIRQGRFDDAEALYCRILGSGPDNVDALNGLAWLLAMRDQGKTQEALELIDRAIDGGGRAPLPGRYAGSYSHPVRSA